MCNGADSFDPITAPPADLARRLTIPCITTRHSNFFGFFREPPDRVHVPALVDEARLRDNCSFAEERPGYEYSVWLSDDYDTVVEVDTGPQEVVGPPGSLLPLGGACRCGAHRTGDTFAFPVRAAAG